MVIDVVFVAILILIGALTIVVVIYTKLQRERKKRKVHPFDKFDMDDNP